MDAADVFCQHSTPDVIAAMLKAGGNVNAKNDDGNRALEAACGWNLYHEVVERLLDAGADLNISGPETPLSIASEQGWDLETAKLLLRRGADVNAQNANGKTPLICAARLTEYNEDLTVYDHDPSAYVTLLLQAGADAKARDKDGNTALDYAKKNPKLVGTAAYRMLERASQ